MPLPKAESSVPASISHVEIEATSVKDAVTGVRTVVVNYHIIVLNSKGERLKPVKGNLIPHLTGAQLSNITNLLNSIVTKAEAEVL